MNKNELLEYKSKLKNLTVLYVEDEEIAREVLYKPLKTLVKNVFLAKNGKEGLKVFEKNKIDLVITDIQMPEMDGIEMIKEIKKIADPQIIIVTAFGDRETFINAINVGVDKYILKPINIDQVILRMYECNSIIELKKQIEKQTELLIAKSRQAAMGEMIGNIAHQWRQPLNTLGLLMYNLYEDFTKYDEKKIDKYYNEARAVIDKMSTTIDDFRNFFKSNKVKENFNLIEVMDETLRLFNASLKNHDIKIEKEYIDKDIKFFGQKNEFSQVLINIISNAKDELVKNSKKDKKIKISIKEIDNKAIIEISDNGRGIDEKIIHKIFEPYFSTKDEDEGSGIGLYMSKVIIEKNMKGKLRAINSENGALFRIELCLTKDDLKINEVMNIKKTKKD